MAREEAIDIIKCLAWHTRPDEERVEQAIEALEQEPKTERCKWIRYDHRTICPKNHDINNPYWRIPENTECLKYCPYCGKEIEVTE